MDEPLRSHATPRSLVCAVTAALLLGLALTLVSTAPAQAEPDDLVLAQSEDDEGSPTLLFGTFRNQEGPVEGIEASVSSEDDTVIETVTTDENGQWEVEVPAGGTYLVTVESLPEGISLREGERSTAEASVDEGQRQAVVFRLGEAAETAGFGAQAAQQLLSGVRFGLIIAMTAVGLSLVFGTTGLINFAHGEFVVFGAILTWFINVSAGVNLILATVLGVVLSGVLGAGVDRVLFRPLRRRGLSLFQLLVVTIGLSLAIRFTLLMFYGGSTRRYTDYVGQQQVSLGPLSATPRDLTIMALSIVVLVLVATMLRTSRLGKAMRAVADNRDLAESSGIDVERIIGIVWIVGAGLAGLGGIFYGTSLGVNYFSGFQLLLLMFAGVILGGLGTAYGAMFGSLVVGIITELSVLWFPDEIKFAWALGVLVIVLLFRPQGLLGRRERIG
ncbi:MAG: branched-chain amino acid ABC transporter permease [Nitriliruptoraceae bacterium]